MIMKERTEIAKIIRRMRLEHELTQDDVANVLGIQRATNTKYEKDHTPKLTILMGLAEFYSTTLDEMLSPLRNEDSGTTVTVHSAQDFANKLNIWVPKDLSKDEKRLILLFRYSKRKNLIIETTRRIVTEEGIYQCG